MAISSFITHGPNHNDDVKYSDEECSTDSFLDYCQQEGNVPKCVDLYNFVHDTDIFSPTNIPQKFDDAYHTYLDEYYDEFEDGFSLIHMQKLTEKDIANHIKEINNDVTRVNFDNNYSYARKQMIVHNFDKKIQRHTGCKSIIYVPISTLLSNGLVHQLFHQVYWRTETNWLDWNDSIPLYWFINIPWNAQRLTCILTYS